MKEPRHDKRPDKTVPLVIYKGGERIIVGQAIMKGDGSISAQIAKDVRKDLQDILYGDMVGGFSIDPKPVVLPDLTYHEVSSTPSPKIQE